MESSIGGAEYSASGEKHPSELNEMVNGAIEQISQLHIDGQVELTSRRWANLVKGAFVPPSKEIIEKTPKREIWTYEELSRQGKGWKLHLNFDAEDTNKVFAISSFLNTLEEKNVISQYKIGHGGGNAANAPGKEATVYVGHKDKTDLVANLLEHALGTVLDDPEGDTLRDDIVFRPHVMGRFDVCHIDPDFYQYGAKGFPLLKNDIRKSSVIRSQVQNNQLPQGELAELKQEVIVRANNILVSRYDAYYTGSSAK